LADAVDLAADGARDDALGVTARGLKRPTLRVRRTMFSVAAWTANMLADQLPIDWLTPDLVW